MLSNRVESIVANDADIAACCALMMRKGNLTLIDINHWVQAITLVANPALVPDVAALLRSGKIDFAQAVGLKRYQYKQLCSKLRKIGLMSYDQSRHSWHMVLPCDWLEKQHNAQPAHVQRRIKRMAEGQMELALA